MIASTFLDTNILVYAAAGREHEEDKRERAVVLMETEDFAVSAQVLQEFFVVVTRKIAVPLPLSEAVEWIEVLETFPCVVVDLQLVKVAIEVSTRHTISYWDAAIVAAAKACGATTLFSEDLNHNQHYDGVRVVNPFH